MSVNLPAALRPVLADPHVQRYLRAHAPAALEQAQRILSKSNQDITPREAMTLAECAAQGADITNLHDLFGHVHSQLEGR